MRVQWLNINFDDIQRVDPKHLLQSTTSSILLLYTAEGLCGSKELGQCVSINKWSVRETLWRARGITTLDGKIWRLFPVLCLCVAYDTVLENLGKVNVYIRDNSNWS